jgi:cerevisin
LALAPLFVLEAEHQHASLNDSYIVMLKHDLDPSLMDNHFNFLQSVHEENPLDSDSDSGIRQVYDGHIKGYAGRFTEGTISKVREMPEVNYVEKDSLVRTMEVQRKAPWVCSAS